MPSFAGLIRVFEPSYSDASDWLDYPSFYPKMPAAQGWCCELKSAARSTGMRPRDLTPEQAGDSDCRAVRGRGQDSEAADRSWRHLSWRARFSAATRTNLASVTDP